MMMRFGPMLMRRPLDRLATRPHPRLVAVEQVQARQPLSVVQPSAVLLALLWPLMTVSSSLWSSTLHD